MLTDEKQTAIDWVNGNEKRLSDWHRTIWRLAEPAWREYRSAAFLVDLLRAEGFTVEVGTGGMPTAFRATYGRRGPLLASFTEYDASPGQAQAPVPRPMPRKGLHPMAPGHVEPRSALGVAALGGMLAAKAAIEAHGLDARLVLFGEPAAALGGAKAIHAAHGCYDDLDAVLGVRLAAAGMAANTVALEDHGGAWWNKVYGFTGVAPESWAGGRAPGALDALCLMVTTTKYTGAAMVPTGAPWGLDEAVLVAGEASAGGPPARLSQIMYAWRSADLDTQARILAVLDANARAAAAATQCRLDETWVSKTRGGIANHALAETVYRNLVLTGPPSFGGEAKRFGREIQRSLGLEPMGDPFRPEMSALTPPREAARERDPARVLADDDGEYSWHAPSARLIVGRAHLRPPRAGRDHPAWTGAALGGFAPAIDPSIFAAARCLGATLIELATAPEALARVGDEFKRRAAGRKRVAPLLAADFRAPVDLRWPEYVTTARGVEWWIPTPGDDVAASPVADEPILTWSRPRRKTRGAPR